MTFADMLSSAATIFIDPALLGAMVAGISMGMVFGAAPGLSGKMGILLLLPLLFDMDPAIGVVLLLSMHSVVHYRRVDSQYPGRRAGRRGRSGDRAGWFRHGQERPGRRGAGRQYGGVRDWRGARRAVLFRPAAGLRLARQDLRRTGISAAGFARPLRRLDAQPRIAAERASPWARLGFLAGTVGMDYATGTPRFMFGHLELWDGIDMLLMVTGLFAMPELIDLARKNTMRPRGE